MLKYKIKKLIERYQQFIATLSPADLNRIKYENIIRDLESLLEVDEPKEDKPIEKIELEDMIIPYEWDMYDVSQQAISRNMFKLAEVVNALISKQK